jgi:AcrR family transcriptional regulator
MKPAPGYSPRIAAVDKPEAASERRAVLARAAYELIAERGLDGLSLRTVARRCGATTGLVSHHFVDRAELVEAALDHATAVVVERLAAAGPDAEPLDLLALVLPTDAATRENWRFALTVRAAAMVDPTLRRFPDAIRRLWERHLPKRLSGRVEGGPRDAAPPLVVVVVGIALQAVVDPKRWPARRQREHLRRGFDALSRRP